MVKEENVLSKIEIKMLSTWRKEYTLTCVAGGMKKKTNDERWQLCNRIWEYSFCMLDLWGENIKK